MDAISNTVPLRKVYFTSQAVVTKSSQVSSYSQQFDAASSGQKVNV